MKLIIVLFLITFITGCAQNSRLGMMPGADGNMYGAAVEKNLVIDATQFEDNSVKVTIRNTSGDLSLDLPRLKYSIEEKLRSKGYSVVTDSATNFRIRYDINVTYSGYIRQNMSLELGSLGAAVGGIAGYRSSDSAGTAIGLVSGVTIGTILGSYISDDTYITVTDVTLAIKKNDSGKVKRKIVFDSSPALQEDHASGITRFEQTLTNKVAVYAGGRNTKQEDIISEVKARLTRILSDII